MASTAIRLLTPRIPLLLKTALLHSLSLSETSTKWDLRSALIITTIRSIIANSTSSITKQQTFFKDPGIRETELIAKVSLSAPAEDAVRHLLFRVIAELDDSPAAQYDEPALRAVEGEWTGYRATPHTSSPSTQTLSPAAAYESLESTITSPLTILYFHGGAHYLCDPSSHRSTTSKLARLTGGRAFSVRYRLAPQNPFPAALLDALVAYMNLLYPGPGALHEAVRPEHIVFAGDSAGGNLALALLLLLLQVGRSGTRTVRWNGNDVIVPLPGGVATMSAWADITRSLPSLQHNAKYDFLPAVTSHTTTAAPSTSPIDPAPLPPCPAWPSPPPRADLYAPGALLCHPLVSPLAASSELWAGAPPLYFAAGEEMLADEIGVVARRCAQAGVEVRWEGFEAMPHTFALLLDGSRVGERGFGGWAGFMREIVAREEVGTRGLWVRALSLEEEAVDVMELAKELSDEEVDRRMRAEMERKVRRWEGLCAEGGGAAKL